MPAVHLADSTRWVSNPDGILSAEGEAAVNRQLQQLAQQTSAEFAVVVVDDLDQDIDEFATALFRKWGLGKKDTNNGLLLIVAKDQREMVFRTGGGVEGLLPDGLLGSIIRNEIRPHFREDDYDGGVEAGVAAVCTVLSSPEGREEILSKYANNSEDDISGEEIFRIYLGLCALFAVLMLALLLITLAQSRGKDRHGRYMALDKIYSTELLFAFVSLGMSLVALVPLLIIRHNLRRGKHLCPNCGTRMNLVDEVHDNDFLDRAQDLEEQIGSVDYDVWLCPQCAETEIIPYVQRSQAYTVCPVCHARAMRVTSDRITLEPTVRHEGIRTITRQCLNCGFQDHENHRLPKEQVPAVMVIPGGGGGRSGGGGFGGGSFGGGFTAGGGARGGW